MWFNGNNSDPEFNVFYASSADGIDWQYSYDPVLLTGNPGFFDDTWVWHPFVMFDEGIYRMWYSGYNGTEWAIGMATDSTLAGLGHHEAVRNAQPEVKFYPNPATDEVHCIIRTGNQQEVKGEIFDSQGKKVRSISEGCISAGEHEISVDVKDLPAGIYFCRMDIGNCQVSEKLVVGQ
jgi:hypothetical protein